MQEQKGATVSDPLNGDRLMGIIKDLVNMGYRRAGTSIEREAAEYILRRFQEIGLQDAHLEEFPINRWEPKNWEITIELEAEQSFSIPCEPAWYSPPTPSEGVQAELCYVGNGTPPDFAQKSVRGRIAVIESKVLFRSNPTYNNLFKADRIAAQQGAQALIVLLDVANNLTPSFPEWEERGLYPLPILFIGRDDASVLRYLLLRNDGIKGFVKLETFEEEATTQDVVGTLPGTGDDFLIVSSHYDATHAGAVDNAGGNAGLLTLAEYFVQKPLNRRLKNILFVAHPAHEIVVGARHFTSTHKDILPQVATYISLDGFGSSGWFNEHNGGAVHTGTDEKRIVSISSNLVLFKIAAEAVRRYQLLPAAYIPFKTIGINPDMSGRFYEAGIPVLTIIGKPLWFHTTQDTSDKCTPDQLERSARAHAEILETLMEIPTKELRQADRTLNTSDPSPLITSKPDAESPTLLFDIIPQPIPVGVSGIFHFVDFRDPIHLLVHFEWDFGDGHQTLGPMVQHVYDTPGRYTVTARATNDAGKVGIASRIVWVV